IDPIRSRRALTADVFCEPDGIVVSSAVMKSSSTVKAHGLIPSTTPATSTVGNVIVGRNACIEAFGAFGCHSPVRATAPSARTVRNPRTTTRRVRVLVTSRLDHQLALHRRVGTAATAYVAIEDEFPRFSRCECRVADALGGRNNAHTEFVDGPLVLSAAIGMVRVVQAGQTDGHRYADGDVDFRLVEACHVSGDVDHVAGHRLEGGPRKGRQEEGARSAKDDDDYSAEQDHARPVAAQGSEFPVLTFFPW